MIDTTVIHDWQILIRCFLLVVLILMDGRVKSSELYLICFASESACHFATKRYVFSSSNCAIFALYEGFDENW